MDGEQIRTRWIQLNEQFSGVGKPARVETFGKPVIDRSKQIAGFALAAFLLP